MKPFALFIKNGRNPMVTLKPVVSPLTATLLLAAVVNSTGWAGALDSATSGQDEYDSQSISETTANKIYSVGLGVGAVPDYLGSQNYKAAFIPYFNAALGANRYVRLRGATLDANLLGDRTWLLGPVVQYRPDPFNDVKNNHVDHLNGPGSAINVGGFVGARFDAWDLRLQVVGDTKGNQGLLTTLGGGYTLGFNPALRLRLGLETSYGSDDYMSAYFGINAANAARSGLKEYDADAGFRDVGLNARLTYDWTRDWTFTANALYMRLVGNAADSPVARGDVGSKNQFFSAVSAIYHF